MWPPVALVRAAGSVPVIRDVDDVAVWCPDEEPAHAPWLCRYRFHDLVAKFLRFFIGSFDVRRVDGNDRVFGSGFVARYELDVRSGVGRGVAGHPSHVELLGTQPEVAGVEALRCLNVSHPEVGHNAYGAHAILLPATYVRDGRLVIPTLPRLTPTTAGPNRRAPRSSCRWRICSGVTGATRPSTWRGTDGILPSVGPSRSGGC